MLSNHVRNQKWAAWYCFNMGIKVHTFRLSFSPGSVALRYRWNETEVNHWVTDKKKERVQTFSPSHSWSVTAFSWHRLSSENYTSCLTPPLQSKIGRVRVQGVSKAIQPPYTQFWWSTIHHCLKNHLNKWRILETCLMFLIKTLMKPNKVEWHSNVVKWFLHKDQNL